MTPEQIALVERNLRQLAPVLEKVAADFYERLFAADPTLRAMFGDGPAQQRAKFAAELETVLLAVRGHQQFLSRTRELGARHAAYGVRAAHYRTGGTALLEAIAEALGAAWTAETAQAWRAAYRLTTEAMTLETPDAR